MYTCVCARLALFSIGANSLPRWRLSLTTVTLYHCTAPGLVDHRSGPPSAWASPLVTWPPRPPATTRTSSRSTAWTMAITTRTDISVSFLHMLTILHISAFIIIIVIFSYIPPFHAYMCMVNDVVISEKIGEAVQCCGGMPCFYCALVGIYKDYLILFAN